MALLPLLVLAVSGTAEAQTYRIVREGPDFVRYDSGHFFVPPKARLKVNTPGSLKIQGENRSSIAYVIKRRLRTKDNELARRVLNPPDLKIGFREPYVEVEVRAEVESPVEVELRVPRTMARTQVQVVDGGITAYDLDNPISVEALSGSVVMDRMHSSVTAFTGGGEIRLGRVDGAIRCQSGGGGIQIAGAGADAVLETLGGEVYVREVIGPLVARTGGGNVVVGRALSTVNAFTTAGLVDVTRAIGMVYARTDNGAIEVGQAAGARCESSSGPIRLNSVTGPLQVFTHQGSIEAAIETLASSNSFLNTGSGDITVFLPSNIAITVQAQMQAAGAIGNIYSDFPEIRMFGRFWLGSRPAQAEGAINGGGPTLRLSANGGIVNLKRQR
ncbi:MAG: DUF4097 family beta strand repeat protein [Acidobacteria bacterium]|nr:DUF4097 family beta strand repeat protein [Acidobacteriota bacterium]